MPIEDIKDPKLVIYVKAGGYYDRAVACRVAQAIGISALDWGAERAVHGLPPFLNPGGTHGYDAWQLGTVDDFWLRKRAEGVFELGYVHMNKATYRREALHGLVKYLNSDLVFGKIDD